ncbi:unnamed protein product [Heligmosomoides polygyrus]|uniref:Uncharacterized protein n=1 Tax=Heligmosomoides polygyrus TaxID=6339 RepID=A0A183FGS3_HELPZ|nr:unnamed protein product [Heligmosomoides polygyrus]
MNANITGETCEKPPSSNFGGGSLVTVAGFCNSGMLKLRLPPCRTVIKMEQCQVDKDEHFWHLLLFAFNGSRAAKALEPLLTVQE